MPNVPGMTGQSLTVSDPRVALVSLFEVPDLLGGPEREAVGIYLRAEGDMPGQMMLILSYEKACEFVDMMMDEEVGTTKQLGRIERSALAEVGNIAGSFFLNAIAKLTGLSSLPSPPAVIVDMVGAILDIIIATSGGVGEHVLMLQASFVRGDREIDAHFWMIPEPSALKAFHEKAG